MGVDQGSFVNGVSRVAVLKQKWLVALLSSCKSIHLLRFRSTALAILGVKQVS